MPLLGFTLALAGALVFTAYAAQEVFWAAPRHRVRRRRVYRRRPLPRNW